MTMAMSAAEAHAAAAAEGLTLVRSAQNSTGFKGVCRTDKISKSFLASLKHGGRNKNLGTSRRPRRRRSPSRASSDRQAWRRPSHRSPRR